MKCLDTIRNCSFNPCYSGRGAKLERAVNELILRDRFNPCYAGRGAEGAICMGRGRVSILVIQEGGAKLYEPGSTRENLLGFNPCYSGRGG